MIAELNTHYAVEDFHAAGCNFISLDAGVVVQMSEKLCPLCHSQPVPDGQAWCDACKVKSALPVPSWDDPGETSRAQYE